MFVIVSNKFERLYFISIRIPQIISLFMCVKIQKVGVKENNKEASASTKEDVQEGGEKSTVEATAVEKPEDASN